MKRIKSIREKLRDGSFDKAIPLGADASNIDMLSGCNLEEELHLGTPSNTSFSTDESGQTVITEEYKKTDEQTDNYYKMITTFGTQSDGNMIITQNLYFMKTAEEQIFKKRKTVTFGNDADNNLQIKEVVQ